MKPLLPSRHSLFFSIFTQGSLTYSVSSSFFPPSILSNVTMFYVFVRIIDNFVDELPIQPHAFYKSKQCFYDELKGIHTGYHTMSAFAKLVKEKNIDVKYIDSFFESMEWDLQKKFVISSLDTCIKYIYGSAEVIGMIMCNLCNITDKKLLHPAAMLGRAMQYINFIRDIHVDYNNGRQYIPISNTSLTNLSYQNAQTHQKEFCAFIRQELHRYHSWILEAREGIEILPNKIRIPLITAGELYHRTAKRIYKNPMSVFTHTKRTNKWHAFYRASSNMLINKKSLITKF